MARPSPTQSYEKLLDAAKEARKPYDREAWLNLAFYLNEQYAEWHEDSGSIRRIPRPINDAGEEIAVPRPVVNKIMHYVRQAHASVLQDKPQPDVMPATDDYTDISDARVAKAWCEDQADALKANYNRQLSNGALWAILAGTAWIKWHWNKDTEQLVITPLSFFEGYVDPFAREFSKARYFIHSQFMDIEQVKETWNADVKAEDLEKSDLAKTALIRGMGSAPILEGVTVNELWHKPCKKYPEGLYVVWTGRTLLTTPAKLPFDHCRTERMLPFTQLGCIERPDSIYFMSPVTYLRSPQMQYNQAWAQDIMTRQGFSNHKWDIPDSIELEALPDDTPNQVLRYTPGPNGERVQILQGLAPPPSGHTAEIEEQMMHVVGQHEVSQAQVPGRVEAAKAIELLKESDAGALSTLDECITESNTIGWWQALMLARQYGPEEAMVLAYSKDGEPEVKAFRAKEMHPGFRIKTSRTTGLARSRAAKEDRAMRMWDSKAITDPAHLAEIMDVPTPTLVSYSADLRLARNENLTLAKGHAVDANSWDDHAIHLREHNDYRKTTEFLGLKDEIKVKFEFHCTRHKDLQKDALKEQALMQALMNGQLPPGEQGPAGQSSPATPPPAGATP